MSDFQSPKMHFANKGRTLFRASRLRNAVRFVSSLKDVLDGHESRLNGLDERCAKLEEQLRQVVSRLVCDLEPLENRMRSEIASASLNLRERISSRMSRKTTKERKSHPPAVRDLQADQRELERLFPNVFPIWQKLFDNAKVEYAERPNTNLSVVDNPGAELFRKFLLTEISGQVLDIGCGPLSLPHYLTSQNVDQIAGIDPLPGDPHRDFEFCQGFAEFLPWPNGEFDSVVIATSLDHVLSVDMTLSEIKRVLAPDGVFALWVAFIEGAKEYDPFAEHVVPIDAFHVFHFDRPWFLKLINRYFVVSEELPVDRLSVFYSLKPRQGTEAF